MELCLSREVVFEKLHYYYAFGNTPPTYVLPGVVQEADVLLLASGDLRSALFSLTTDATSRHPVRFTVNDADKHVIARNVVLVWLAHHAEPHQVFAVWFSLGLTPSTSEVLHSALATLAADEAGEQFAKVDVSFFSDADREEVLAVLRAWSTWRLDWTTIQRQRKAKLLDFFSRNAEKHLTFEQLIESAKGSFQMAVHTPNMMQCKGKNHPGHMPETAMEEVGAYFREGVVSCLVEPTALANLPNPTLFKSPDAYDLHYASDPFKALPTYASSYDPRRPLTTLGLSFMAAWVDELRQRKRAAETKVTWEFAIGDCMRMCAKLLPRRFSVVSTSNVADHIGLLSLLQAARMVTRPDGLLLTETLLHLSYSSDHEDYLRANLIVPSEMWPGVFGWRCIGYEGDLAPQSSEVQFVMPDFSSLLLKQMNEGTRRLTHGKHRGEAHFVWTPAAESSTPLSLSSTLPLGALFDLCRLKKRDTMFGSWVAAASSNDGINRLHLCTLLPILCSSADAATYLCEEDVELLDLLAFVRGQKPLTIAAIELSDAALDASVEPQPHLCVLLTTESGSTFLYSALWLDYVDGHRLVRFLVDSSRLAGATVNLVGAHLLSHGLGSYHDVEATPCPGPPSALATWLASLAGKAESSGQLIMRQEEKECWKLSIDLAGEWWARIEAGDTIDTRACDGSARLEVFVKQHPELRIQLALPSPFSTKGHRLLLSRKRQNLTIVIPKAAYDFASRSPAELFLDNFDVWPVCRPDDSFMVTASGIQMSDEEKFISRSRELHQIPALIALKDTAMFFFQRQDDAIMQIAVSEDGKDHNVHAIALHHGVRREVCNGTPVADVSICFLEFGFLQEVLPWWQTTYDPRSANGGSGMRNVMCTTSEYELLKQFVKLLASRAKDQGTWTTPPKRHAVPKKLRHRFVRVLFPPLFAHEKILNRTLLDAATSAGQDRKSLTLAEQIRALKDKGSKLVKEGRHSEAIGPYRQAVVRFGRHRKEKDDDDAKLLAAQCHLNMALCLLHPKTPESSTEAVICCDAALGLLLPSQTAWRAKAYYRKGQALELSGDMASAIHAYTSAKVASPADDTISRALAKLQERLQA